MKIKTQDLFSKDMLTKIKEQKNICILRTLLVPDFLSGSAGLGGMVHRPETATIVYFF